MITTCIRPANLLEKVRRPGTRRLLRSIGPRPKIGGLLSTGIQSQRRHTHTVALHDSAIDYLCTMMGSPTRTMLKYHSAFSGLRLMHPWLTLAEPCAPTDHGAECTYTPPQVTRTPYSPLIR